MALLSPIAWGIFLFLIAFNPLQSAVAAPQALERAYEAHGAAALEGARTLELKVRVIDTWINQDIAPGPPWTRSTGYRWHAVDFAGRRYASQAHVVHAGFYPSYARRIVTPEGGRLINLQERTWSPAAGGEEAFHARSANAKAELAPWVVWDAMNDPEASFEGTTEIEGKELTVVTARLGDGAPATLYFDRETGLLARLAREGDPEVRVYGSYQQRASMTVNGETHIYYRGNMVVEHQLLKLALDGEIEFLFETPADFQHIDLERDADARAFSVRKLDPGVWFVGEDVFYQLFVEFEDFLVAVGGIGGVDKRLAAIREITGKPLRYAVVTHHHSDHLEGVPALARAGASIVVAEGNQAVTRAALGEAEAEILSVADRHTISDGCRKLEIYQIGPGAHAAAMLAAYLPGEKILYTGDLLVQPPGRPMRARIPPIRDLVIAIETFGLDVERHLDPHSPRVATREEIYRAFYK